MHELKKKIFFWFCMYKMVDISTKTWNNAGVDVIIIHYRGENKPVLWLRIKDIGRELDAENIYNLMDKEIKGRFETDNPTDEQIKKYKRYGSEFIENKKFMYVHEDIIMPVIMHCRVATPKSTEFRSKLGFNQDNITLIKEQSVLKSVMDAFEGEKMQTQYSVLGYRIDLYFHDYKLAVEVDEKGHRDRIIDQEVRRQKALEKELGCEFIRINPDEENFNIFKAINEIHRHIKELTKKSTRKSLIDELSNKLLRPEFKSDNPIKTKCLKYVVKHIFLTL